MGLEDLTNQFGPVMAVAGIVWEINETEAGIKGGKTELTFYIPEQNTYFLYGEV